MAPMTTSSSDVLVRGERLRALTVGRALGAALVAAVLTTVGRDLVPADGWPLLGAITTVHLSVQLLVLLGRVHRDTTLRALQEITLVVDLAAIAALMVLTGGTSGPLDALLLVEIVAVTLLFGRWAGLRAALLASVAVAWALFAAPATLVLAIDAVRRSDPALAATLDPGTRATLLLVALWGTTLVTGWLSEVTERHLRRRTDDLAVLRDLTPALDPRRGPERVAEVLAETLVGRLGYASSAVWLADDDRFTLAATAGAREEPDGPTALDASDPTVVAALADGQIRPVRRDGDRPTPLVDRFGRSSPVVLVPLRGADGATEALAAVEVATRLRRRRGPVLLHARDVHLLRMLADHAAVSVASARTQSDLADLAVTDAVTGLPNHRYLQQRLGEELERLSRATAAGHGRPLSFALFDLDHFKRVNDTYGHQTGDRVLATVAAVADRTLRGSDVVCRYGGEEFAIVLVDTDAVQARRACERVRLAVSGVPITSTDGQDLPPVTASFGIATLRSAPADRDAFVAAADDALYAAKQLGRDRVVHHDDEVPGTHDGPRPVAGARGG